MYTYQARNQAQQLNHDVVIVDDGVQVFLPRVGYAVLCAGADEGIVVRLLQPTQERSADIVRDQSSTCNVIAAADT